MPITNPFYLTWSYSSETNTGSWSAASSETGPWYSLDQWTIPSGGISTNLYFGYSGDDSAPDQMFCVLTQSGIAHDVPVRMIRGHLARSVVPYTIYRQVDLIVGTLVSGDPKIQVTQSTSGVTKNSVYLDYVGPQGTGSSQYSWTYSTTSSTTPGQPYYVGSTIQLAASASTSGNLTTYIQVYDSTAQAAQAVLAYQQSGTEGWTVWMHGAMDKNSQISTTLELPAGTFSVDLYDPLPTTATLG